MSKSFLDKVLIFLGVLLVLTVLFFGVSVTIKPNLQNTSIESNSQTINVQNFSKENAYFSKEIIPGCNSIEPAEYAEVVLLFKDYSPSEEGLEMIHLNYLKESREIFVDLTEYPSDPMYLGDKDYRLISFKIRDCKVIETESILLDGNEFTQNKSSLATGYTGDTKEDCPTNINYLYKNYTAYALAVRAELEQKIDVELSGKAYGGNEGQEQLRECGKVYFIMLKAGEWNSCRYWALEVDAETGELLRWEEVSKGTNEIDYEKLWWNS